jgi:hypothetical protein
MATRSTAQRNERQSGASGGRQSQQRGRQQYQSEQEGYLARGNEQIREMVEDHEGQAVLIALAVGFGIGVVLGYGLGGSQHEERWTDRIAAEGLGRRFLERLDTILPEAVTSRFAK